MVISTFHQKPCFTCLSGADPHSFHCFTEIGQIFHNRLLSCKASSEEKELAKLSCLNDSETQERGLWEVKIEKNFPLGHAPEPRKSLGLRRSFRKSVSINPRSAPASRFCSCFIIRMRKQRRFWVMHVNRKWILYPFSNALMVPNLYSLVSFLSRKRFAEKKWSNRRPKIAKTPHPVEVCGSKNILCA